jgi:hypothetical protein
MTTLENTFHNTTVCVRAMPGDTLSRAQVRRAWKALCGWKDCTCGGAGGVRGGAYVITCRTYWPDPADGRPYRLERRTR